MRNIGINTIKKEVTTIKRIQLYIPSLFEFHDRHSRKREDEIKIVGLRKKSIVYFSGNHKKEQTHIDRIVAEDFTIYDLKLNYEDNILSFYLEHEVELNQMKILEKVFETFIVEYNSQSFGYFTMAKGRNRPITSRK